MDFFINNPLHTAILLCAIIVFLLFCIYVAVRVTRRILVKSIEKATQSTHVQVDERIYELRDRITQLSRGYGQIVEAARKGVREEVGHLGALVAENLSDGQENIKTLDTSLKATTQGNRAMAEEIKGMFEQQALFLHDRFSESASRETQNTEQLQQTFQAAQDQAFAALKSDITHHIHDLMQKERALQQESQKQASTLLSDSINRLTGEVDAKLALVTDRVSSRFNDNLASTMASFNSLTGHIDALISAKKDIDALGQDVSSLARLILNKNAAADHAHLPDMLSAMLPDDSYILNPTINGVQAAAQLMLPGESGAMIIDASLPLFHFDQLIAPTASESQRAESRRQFGQALQHHIDSVTTRFIRPPQTGASAILFIPSETAFAEIQAHHKDRVHQAARQQIWMVSPTTLTAALNMARSALKDQQARHQLEQMRLALTEVVKEAQNFEARLLEIGDHVNQAMRSVQRAESAGSKLFGDVRGIADIAQPKAPLPAALPPSDNNRPPPA